MNLQMRFIRLGIIANKTLIGPEASASASSSTDQDISVTSTDQAYPVYSIQNISVGFGSSAGDFIAALDLVSTVIDALRDSGDSSTEYRALNSQFFTLETALIKVKRLDVDEEQHAEVVSLRQAACQSQNTIDTFWEKIKKHQPSLRAGGSGSRVRDGWFKIKWALCKKDDLLKFKTNLMGHTKSIELLLITLHMGSTRIAGKKQEAGNRTLATRIQESYFGVTRALPAKKTIVMGLLKTETSTGLLARHKYKKRR